MAFLEERISHAIMRGSSFVVRGRRTKKYVENGRLSQNFHFSRPLHGCDLRYALKSVAQIEEVRAFFYVVMFTPYEGFRARDWADYQLTQSNSSLTFITGTTWQVRRKYTVGSSTFLRDIYKLDGTPTIYRTRSSVTSIITPSVNVNTGVVTIVDHVGGDTYTCVGEFDVPVTFEDDAIDGVEVDGFVNRIRQKLPPIRLEEIRLS